jgi:hypothetical protein
MPARLLCVKLTESGEGSAIKATIGQYPLQRLQLVRYIKHLDGIGWRQVQTQVLECQVGSDTI